MKYKMKAHPTNYAGVRFRSRLEARWAAFFNCMSWKWQYEPIDLENWSPDFRLWIKELDVFAEVKPYFRLDQFRLHPCWDLGFCLGIEPVVSGLKYQGKVITLYDLADPISIKAGWIAAGNLTQYKKRKKK